MNLLLQIFQLRTATCHEAFLAVGALRRHGRTLRYVLVDEVTVLVDDSLIS
jgi:hypothetical protein